MDYYNKKLISNLIISIMLTIFFPIGVLGIIFGATKHITILLVFGIILTILGFYVSPVMWGVYGNTKSLKIVLNLIVNEYMYSVSDIATHLNKSEEEIRTKISTLIEKGYLKGYIYKDGFLELNTNKKQTGEHTKTIKCTNCGGTMHLDGINYVCDYCGTVKHK